MILQVIVDFFNSAKKKVFQHYKKLIITDRNT